MPSATLRPARLGDDKALARTDHLSWTPQTDPGDHWPPERRFFGPPTGTRTRDVIVAEVDGEVRGFIKLRPNEPETGSWYIGGLAVHPAARGQGLARALVNTSLAVAGQLGARRVWLKVLGSNTVALALYGSVGFTEYHREPGRFTRNGQPVDDIRLELRAPLERDNGTDHAARGPHVLMEELLTAFHE